MTIVSERKRRNLKKDEGKGIGCPSCGGTMFKVYYTRRRWDQSIVRMKICGHCGHRYRTEERLER